MANVLIVDDHQAVLEGLEAHFEKRQDIQIVGTATSKKKVFDLLWRTEVDMIILDIKLRDADGKEVAEPIKEKYPHIKILIHSMDVKWNHMKELEELGIDGYVHKGEDISVLSEALDAILYGEGSFFGKEFTQKKEKMALKVGVNGQKFKLSKREKETLKLMADGLSIPEISQQLKLSINTVTTYKKRLLNKTHCKSIAELVKFAIDEGYI